MEDFAEVIYTPLETFLEISIVEFNKHVSSTIDPGILAFIALLLAALHLPV